MQTPRIVKDFGVERIEFDLDAELLPKGITVFGAVRLDDGSRGTVKLTWLTLPEIGEISQAVTKILETRGWA